MFTKLFKSTYFKSIAVFMSFAMLTMSFTMPPSNKVVLKAGTPIPMILQSTITSDNAKSGQIVQFMVLSDIIVDGQIVIRGGSTVEGQISKVKKNGLLGTPGELSVVVRSVQAVDGTMIYLNNASLYDEGDNKLAVSIVITLFCIFGFLIKGGEAELPYGTQITATVLSNTEINL